MTKMSNQHLRAKLGELGFELLLSAAGRYEAARGDFVLSGFKSAEALLAHAAGAAARIDSGMTASSFNPAQAAPAGAAGHDLPGVRRVG